MQDKNRPIYLDFNATTPMHPKVRDVVLEYMDREFGNAGSHTHVFGQQAAKGVKKAREQVSELLDSQPSEVLFTSGATEASNIAILGLAAAGKKSGRKHIVSTKIEHKAVLEPLEVLAKNGFEVELVSPTPDGDVDPEDVRRRVRTDTLLVSVMHVNNETGIIQPINDIAELLQKTDAYFYVDAAQGFGKDLQHLTHPRIDLVSISGHKIYGPKGVGALLVRNARKASRHLTPLTYGGGQERGLRPGTIPTHLVCGLGAAAELAGNQNHEWHAKCAQIEHSLRKALASLPITYHGALEKKLPNVLNMSVGEIPADAIVLALKDDYAFSTGSACTSNFSEPSHVLAAMKGIKAAESAFRISWGPDSIIDAEKFSSKIGKQLE